MSRTGASTSRTSTSQPKRKSRKPRAKNASRLRRAASARNTGRARLPAKQKRRHEIRTRRSREANLRHAASSVATRRKMKDVASQSKAASLRTADDTKMMKKATTHKPVATANEKEKRKASPGTEPPKLKSSPVPTEAKQKMRKTVAQDTPAETAPDKVKSRRKRSEDQNGGGTRRKAGRGTRSKTFGFDDALMQDYVMDNDVGSAGIDEELTIDPVELPLELLDPELVEVPRPASPPKPKPKPVSNKREQKCANCGNTFLWLSVEQLCFSCLKKKLSQRKREDETYPGFTGEPEEEEETT